MSKYKVRKQSRALRKNTRTSEVQKLRSSEKPKTYNQCCLSDVGRTSSSNVCFHASRSLFSSSLLIFSTSQLLILRTFVCSNHSFLGFSCFCCSDVLLSAVLLFSVSGSSGDLLEGHIFYRKALRHSPAGYIAHVGVQTVFYARVLTKTGFYPRRCDFLYVGEGR